LIDRLKIWLHSKPWFWATRTRLGEIAFSFESSAYQTGTSISEARTNARILYSFALVGVKSLFGVVLVFAALYFAEDYVAKDLSWLPPISAEDRDYNVEQLRLYAQLLTAIFSIYFATIGIILSAGYTRLRRDIIHLLTNEQVGSAYSRVLVFSAMFCLASTAAPLIGFQPGLFVYSFGTILTLLSALALFPLGQRLFNFFDLNLLVQTEILPKIARHIDGAANPRNSNSLANHHSRAARKALEQLYYIDNRIKSDKEGLKDNLPALSNAYSTLVVHYFQKKHNIAKESYWFPRRIKHKQWFLAGDSATSMALQSSSQQMLIEEKSDHQWFENEIVERLASHIELAFQVGDFALALKLIGRLSSRISAYAVQLQFDVGLQELKRIKEIIELAFASANQTGNTEAAIIKIGIADTWAALGSNLCLETLRRMMTFEKELKQYFDTDDWSEKSLRSLPVFLQVELAFIVEGIEFEQKIEGQRLSRPRYVQQLAVQKLLQYYAKALPTICDFYQNIVPDFVDSLTKLKMSEAATQVVLGSLHSHWKLPHRFDEIGKLLDRYQAYNHYTEEQYTFSEINTAEMSKKLASARDKAIATLGSGAMIEHIFEQTHNDELPDHFGQIYFELAEACISALEQNDESMLNKVFPTFLILAFLAADSKFTDPSLEVNDEFRLHLISTVINDLASVLGFAILYGAYFDNEHLSENALAKFNSWIERIPNKQEYLKRMLHISDPHRFSMSASPRGLIRINWKMSFEHRARSDGFGDQMSIEGRSKHQNEIVREFLRSTSDASHLFFAKQVLPQLDTINFDINHHITALAHNFHKDDEAQHEDF
jgi:hypothetical protein